MQYTYESFRLVNLRGVPLERKSDTVTQALWALPSVCIDQQNMSTLAFRYGRNMIPLINTGRGG